MTLPKYLVHYAATEFCTLVCDKLLDRYSKKLGIAIFVFTTRSFSRWLEHSTRFSSV